MEYRYSINDLKIGYIYETDGGFYQAKAIGEKEIYGSKLNNEVLPVREHTIKDVKRVFIPDDIKIIND